jgi:hypothetical protein
MARVRNRGLLLGLVLLAGSACTRPTPGYCGPDGSDKCGPGLVCNQATYLCDRSGGGGGSGSGGGGGRSGGGGADAADARLDTGMDAGGDTADAGCTTSLCPRCQSCTVPGFEGRCAPIPQHSDDPGRCVGDLTCDGFGGCLLKVGKTCGNATDCASSICADGVCCDQACTEACRSCNQAANLGTCSPINGAEDLSAITPCTGANICTTAGGTPACKLKDGQTCATAAQCANGSCLISYLDADTDGYGVATTITRCDLTPPSGYAARAGDCCDSDNNARPNQTTPSTTRNACNSFDWDCDGTEERTSTVAFCGCQTIGTTTVCGPCI